MRFAHRWRLANRRTVIRLINSGSAASSGMPFDLLLRSLHPKDLMPIRRQHLWLYPIDWRELSASIRFRRAKGRCEHCDGRWWDEERQTWRNGQGRPVALLQAPGSITEARTTRVILATAHLQQPPAEPSPRFASGVTFCMTAKSTGAGGGSCIGCGGPWATCSRGHTGRYRTAVAYPAALRL